MQITNEKLSLQWNDFRINITSAFKDLRLDHDFTDVTLACEDGQVDVHKLVLISSSPFFKNLLKRNKHNHPLIYMKGIRFEDLSTLMDLIYQGEANVDRANLDNFLALGRELQMKGLQENVIAEMVERQNESIWITKQETESVKTEIFRENTYHHQNDQSKATTASDCKSNVALQGSSNFTDLSDLRQKVKSLMGPSENGVPRVKKCNICGKEGERTVLRNHIEANHLTGVKIPCHMCSKVFQTRCSQAMHSSRTHRQ